MKKIIAALLSGMFIILTAGCSNSNATQTSGQTDGKKLTILADLVPHSELLEFVKPKLAQKGIDLEIISAASDGTWNSRVESGEVDANFNQHYPYLKEWNEKNNGHVVNAGNIHVEPIAAYSVKYKQLSEIPDNASIVIPNDATNEYRALKILEQAGFIKLRPDLDSLRASLTDVSQYVKPVSIKEIDSAQIINMSEDFDIYITNTNKILEAGIDPTTNLFREDGNSPYANIIAVKSGRENDSAIQELVKELRSDDTKNFIKEKYKGAVIPAA
ncbi:MetQ/NlpA family ABC transporter substrate-binding protein [Pectinatus haikarae]|uniref:Lipoprotein n=1 Tax=Pectinatus haikarae TaxID=349096 RepID=A0ABT9Y9N9_9FIRM|nr:MetQ/NlpA family ABC transporter substrate-binding protein [Pectinatus haikarae]MDQ0204527.1 D-methionine transport system substrate-binding protein [Pectinatus haikarae]